MSETFEGEVRLRLRRGDDWVSRTIEIEAEIQLRCGSEVVEFKIPRIGDVEVMTFGEDEFHGDAFAFGELHPIKGRLEHMNDERGGSFKVGPGVHHAYNPKDPDNGIIAKGQFQLKPKATDDSVTSQPS